MSKRRFLGPKSKRTNQTTTSNESSIKSWNKNVSFFTQMKHEGCLRKQHFVASQILNFYNILTKLQVTSYKLEGNEFVTWKMHLLCFKGCVTCKPELYACGLRLRQKNNPATVKIQPFQGTLANCLNKMLKA